jgi:molybdopterin/thiamine biosynthesis adenylyltransferase
MVDMDTVELSNLQRQVLQGTESLGRADDGAVVGAVTAPDRRLGR